MTTRSMFQQLQDSAAMGRARSMDQRVSSGRVLFHSTFDHGMDGWRSHVGAVTPYPVIGRTSYPVMSGAHALMVSTGPRGGSSNSAARYGSAYKNLSRYFTTGLVSFSGWFATGTMTQDDSGFQGWGIGIDTQQWDDSSRGFYKLNYSMKDDSHIRQWSLTNDGGFTVWIPGADKTTVAGSNEGKYNFNYVRLTIDLSANGGLGGFYEAQINNRVFDLTGLGAGRGLQTPQAGSNMASFAGGLNFGILTSNTTLGDKGPTIVYADDLVGSIQEA